MHRQNVFSVVDAGFNGVFVKNALLLDRGVPFYDVFAEFFLSHFQLDLRAKVMFAEFIQFDFATFVDIALGKQFIYDGLPVPVFDSQTGEEGFEF